MVLRHERSLVAGEGIPQLPSTGPDLSAGGGTEDWLRQPFALAPTLREADPLAVIVLTTVERVSIGFIDQLISSIGLKGSR